MVSLPPTGSLFLPSSQGPKGLVLVSLGGAESKVAGVDDRWLRLLDHRLVLVGALVGGLTVLNLRLDLRERLRLRLLLNLAGSLLFLHLLVDDWLRNDL